MSKKLLVAVAVMAVAFSGAGFAAVESIKVSGEVDTYTVTRSDYALGSNLIGYSGLLRSAAAGAPTMITGAADDNISVLASVTKLRFDVDLTEEIEAVLELVDERVWGLQADDVYVETAYVTLKDVLEGPVTLKIGKQPVRLGAGSVLGDFDGPTNFLASTNSAFDVGLIPDLSPRKNVAGVTATVDLSPFVIDLGYLKVNEADVTARALRALLNGGTVVPFSAIDDDTDVYFFNAAYIVEGQAAAELYWIHNDSQQKALQDNIQTFGLKLGMAPMDALIMGFEAAYQRKKESIYTGGREDGHDLNAWQAGFLAQYSFLDIDWAPSVTFDIGFSSVKWDPLYEDITTARIIDALLPSSNGRCIGVTFAAQPREDLNVKVRWVNVSLMRAVQAGSNSALATPFALTTPTPVLTAFATQPTLIGNYATYIMGANNNDKDVGDEIDITLSYDYTEDVQLGLCMDYFIPGDAFSDVNDERAFQALGSMKVTF